MLFSEMRIVPSLSWKNEVSHWHLEAVGSLLGVLHLSLFSDFSGLVTTRWDWWILGIKHN